MNAPGDFHRQCATGEDFWLPDDDQQHPLTLTWWEKLLLLAALFLSVSLVAGAAGYVCARLSQA
jgi:hypothetical protein